MLAGWRVKTISVNIAPTDLVLWVDILVRMFSGSASALCPLLCLKKSMTVLRLEALVEGAVCPWSSMSSGGTFSLASCADCLLRFIMGRRMGKPLRPPSSSSAVLKRPKRILQGIQLPGRAATPPKEREMDRKERQKWKVQTEKQDRPLSQAANERMGHDRQPHQP